MTQNILGLRVGRNLKLRRTKSEAREGVIHRQRLNRRSISVSISLEVNPRG